MASESNMSFVNGIIAGAGAVLAIMSFAFVNATAPLEGMMGFESTEVRVAILLGAIVCVVTVGYEFYRKKEIKEQEDKRTDQDLDEIKKSLDLLTKKTEQKKTKEQQDKSTDSEIKEDKAQKTEKRI